MFEKYKEIISYLFWGVCTTGVSWGTYALVSLLVRTDAVLFGIPFVVIVSNVLSWIFAMTFAFVTNKLWVFQSKSWKRQIVIKEFTLFFSARLMTGILEIVMVPVAVRMGLSQSLFGIEGALAKIVVSFAVVVLNYIFSKLWIFKKTVEN